MLETILTVYIILVIIFGLIASILLRSSLKNWKWYKQIAFYLASPFLMIRELQIPRKET